MERIAASLFESGLYDKVSALVFNRECGHYGKISDRGLDSTGKARRSDILLNYFNFRGFSKFPFVVPL